MTSEEVKGVPDIIDDIRRELKAAADPATLASFQRFFKEGVTAYGLKTAEMRRVATLFWKQVKDRPKEELYRLCEELFASGYYEDGAIAIGWAERLEPRYEASDFRVYERWLATCVHNWAHCDTLCNHPVGTLVMKFPAFLADLKRWTGSANLWVRRGAAVSLIIPGRRGLFLEDIFEIADQLLHDPEDLVQKGYGWMLKAAAEAHETEVFDYVMAHRADMPRTALRYAIEKMPTARKKAAMARP
jgi:3-methyladenine DNA glycosylase AlkD